MSDAAPDNPVTALRSELERAQVDLGLARQDADERARALQERPSREAQVARNDAEQVCELLDLTIARLQRDLSAAQERERQDGIAGRLTGHSTEVMGPAAASERRAREHLAGLEQELAELMGLRNVTRGTTRALMALGYDGHPPQLGLRVDAELVRRMEALAGQYRAALKEVGGQVGRLMAGDGEMASVAELERQKAQAAALEQALKARDLALQRYTAAEADVKRLEDQDFAERLAGRPLSEMTMRERSEVAAKLGAEEFQRLVVSGRR